MKIIKNDPPELSQRRKKNRMPTKRISIFWEKVNKSGGPDSCWPFVGGVAVYGRVRMDFIDARNYAHRAAYILANGSIDPALDVLHKCNNTVCCNPKHLYAGTHKQNMDDRDERYRTGELIRRPHPAGGKGRKPNPETQVRNDKLIKEYNDGVSIQGLAAMFKLNINTIYSVLNKNGIFQDARYAKKPRPTLAQVDAARTTADDLTPGGPVVVYETRPE
jgi:hypothetical protein